MTREEWLSQAASVSGVYDRRVGSTLSAISSFPRTPARRVILGELVKDDDGRLLALINPTINDPVEVLAVYTYLNRRRIARPDGPWPVGRITSAEAVMLRFAFDRPYHLIIPTDDLIPRLERWAADLPPYPAARVPVETAAQRQTTRMIKLMCADFHEPYIVRASRRTIDRGLPICGVCGSRMAVANATSANLPIDND